VLHERQQHAQLKHSDANANAAAPSRRGNRNDILTLMGSLFASAIFLGVYNASSVQPVVATERTVFYRERAAGAVYPVIINGLEVPGCAGRLAAS